MSGWASWRRVCGSTGSSRWAPAPSSIAVAGVREGVEPDDVASYPDPDAALADVRAHAGPGDLVLVKASRVAGLERLAEALR